MLTPSQKGIVTDGLIYNVDLANYNSWGVNIEEGFTLIPSKAYSLPTAHKTEIASFELADYGLTEIDMGRTANLRDAAFISTRESLVLALEGYPMVGSDNGLPLASGDTTGYYVQFNGIPFQGFFKLEGYAFEALPPRYAEGVTLETSLAITESTFAQENNIFLFLGARAGNKFYANFNTLPNVNTSNGIPLGPDHVDEPELGVEGNAICFLFDKNGRIGYRTVTDELEIVEEFSTNRITHTGWVNISLAYTPCEAITDPDLLECAPRRGGFLRVYVNGVLFHEFEGFQEFMFHGLQTEKEKQIGVPYTLVWGGGTKGLYNSHFFSEDGTPLVYNLSGLLLDLNFQGYFNGGAQTLRIYNRPLSVLEARSNHNAFALRYDLPVIKGGRVTPKIDW